MLSFVQWLVFLFFANSISQDGGNVMLARLVEIYR